MSAEITYPATIALGNFLGSHIVATELTVPAECVNCQNEGPPS